MTNQQLKAHCEDVIASPQDHSEIDLAMAKALLPCLVAVPVAWVTMQPNLTEDERTVFTKKDLADRFSKICYDLTPLYPAPPVAELKPVRMPQRYTTRIGTDLVSGTEVTRVVMIPDEHGQWLSIYDVEHEFNRMRGIPS